MPVLDEGHPSEGRLVAASPRTIGVGVGWFAASGCDTRFELIDRRGASPGAAESAEAKLNDCCCDCD